MDDQTVGQHQLQRNGDGYDRRHGKSVLACGSPPPGGLDVLLDCDKLRPEHPLDPAQLLVH
jgi:hypothetical protein